MVATAERADKFYLVKEMGSSNRCEGIRLVGTLDSEMVQ